MSDEANYYPQPLGAIQSLNSPKTPFGECGHVNFSRHDGVGNVSITSTLTADAALQLDVFLRKLIEADAPKLMQQARAAHEQAYSEQRKALEYAQLRQAGQGRTGWDD